MAQVEIALERLAESETLPDVCARCGNSGTTLIAVPQQFAKPVEGLVLPFCSRHPNDWASVRFRTRLGAFLLLNCMLSTAATVWQLYPQFARPNEQNEFSRWSATLFFGLISAMPIGALLAWWAKSPIRVQGVVGRFATIIGVCRAFARVMKASAEPTPLEVGDAPRFEVHPYFPKPDVPLNRAGNALAILFVLAAILGSAIGLGGLEIQSASAGWDRNDWRYVPMTLGIVFAYMLPLIPFRLLASRIGCVVVLVLAAIVLLGLGAFGIGGSMKIAFSIAFTGSALLLLQFLAQRLIWRWKLRSTVIAVAAGTGSTLTLTAFAFMLAGMQPGPHQSAYVLGIVFAIVGVAMSRSAATSPFCAECDAWLTDRRIGALPRSLAEVRPCIESGRVVALADVKPYDATASIGDVELKVFVCSDCRDRGTVVLELFDCLKGGKSGKQPILTRIGRWEYPGSALPGIEALFPPPPEQS